MGKQPHLPLGTDTFKGTAAGAGSLSSSAAGAATSSSSGSTRPALFGKTAGQLGHDSAACLLTVASPVSGSALKVPDGAGVHHHAAVKDPITGTVLSLDGGRARVVTPVMVQPQVHSRKLFLTSDIDIAIATLRATTTCSDKTNEKLGTSGSATGLDGALVSGGTLRCAEKKRKQTRAAAE